MTEPDPSAEPREAAAAAPEDRQDARHEELRDELPDDLNSVDYVGVYQFPGNERRRYPALLALVAGVAMAGGWLLRRDGDPVLVSPGVGVGGVLLILWGLYVLSASARLKVREVEALAAASRSVGFPVGHAAAQMGWRGLRSRPTWRILLYSAENPPLSRGLVLVDGTDGRIIEQFVEANPEDWSGFRLPGGDAESGS